MLHRALYNTLCCTIAGIGYWGLVRTVAYVTTSTLVMSMLLWPCCTVLVFVINLILSVNSSYGSSIVPGPSMVRPRTWQDGLDVGQMGEAGVVSSKESPPGTRSRALSDERRERGVSASSIRTLVSVEIRSDVTEIPIWGRSISVHLVLVRVSGTGDSGPTRDSGH